MTKNNFKFLNEIYVFIQLKQNNIDHHLFVLMLGKFSLEK